MKEYFKYGSGYINIDDGYLYLTNSGNWQEARELKEKSTATIKNNNRRISNINGFLYTLITIFAFLVYFMIDTKKISISLIALLACAGFYTVQYFKSDLGYCYKIPLSKIDTIEKYGNGLKISFRNEANSPDFEILKNVEQATIEFLTHLHLTKLN
jgi:hypothetical protein